MSTFFLFLGILLIVWAIISFIASAESYSYEDEWMASAIISLIVGIVMTAWAGIYKLCDKTITENPKTEVVVVDSTQVQVQVPKDSIGEIKFIITWKDEDGVWAGKNVKLMGRTEKGINDTIIIKIPQ